MGNQASLWGSAEGYIPQARLEFLKRHGTNTISIFSIYDNTFNPNS